MKNLFRLLVLAFILFSCEKEEVEPVSYEPAFRYLKITIRDCNDEVIKVFILDQLESGEKPIGIKRETCKGIAITNTTFYGKIILEEPENDRFTVNRWDDYPTLVKHNMENGLEIETLKEL